MSTVIASSRQWPTASACSRLAHVGEVVLVALRERGDRGLEGGFAEEVVGLEGHRPAYGAQPGGGAVRRAFTPSARTTQRKPRWLVDVSIASPWRAAGR